MSGSENKLACAILDEVRLNFQKSMARIEHCLGQLTDEQLWWRPREEMNSIANLLLHLSGNLRQWLISGVGQTPDMRNRPAEFADRSFRPRAQIEKILRDTLAEVDALIDGLSVEELLASRRIQGGDETVLGALLHTATHFQGHAQEIIHLTRVQLGENYRFDYLPRNPEQLSAHGPAL